MKGPYRLPVMLTCDESELSGGITIEIVEKYIRKHQEMFRRYEYLENLYRGFHDIFKQPEKEQWKPDNRLAANFPRYMTDTFTGYGYGIPIKVSHPDDAVNAAVQEFGRQNEVTDHDAELIKRCCIYGHAFEYLYQEDGTQETKVSELSPKDVFVVYDDTLKHRALFAVRYGYHDADGANAGKVYGSLMTREYIRPFEGTRFFEEDRNPYGRIPVIEWRLNDERIGLYENAAGLIEMYNHTLSEKGNDVDAFADAYLSVLGAELDEDQIYRIRDDRVINFYGTDNAKDVLVQFLQKPTADGTQENLLTRLENLIYQTSMVANISDESFGNASSGTALSYKLQAMSNLARGFDRKIEKSLRKRYKLIGGLVSSSIPEDAYKEIEIHFTRNLPKNTLEEAQTAQALEGMVSKETQLSVLSIVDDPKAEIEKLDEEDSEARDTVLNQTLFSGAPSGQVTPEDQVDEQ